VPAILARAAQDDVVSGYDVPASVCDALDRGLEGGILERLDLPAVVAHEVVMMVTTGVSRLESRDAIAEVYALHEAQRVHALECAVHARDPDASAPSTDTIVDLVCREAAVLFAEQLDDEPPRSAASPARPAQARERRFRPAGHSDNDTRSQRRATVARVRIAVVVLAVLALSGCGGASEEGDAGPTVVAGFYPLAWAAEGIAGPDARIVNLTPAGAEPHDLELSPDDIRTVREADLVLYVGGGFQPALEDAVADRSGPSLDVLDADESDPHIWLDPVRFSRVVHEIGQAMGQPTEARGSKETLAEIDSVYRRALQDCVRSTFVTTHAAFGHLAARYGLTQLSLTGVTPESEPSPRQLERLIAEVEASGATVVFAEPLVSDDVAATVAHEAGLDVSVLDPLEGLSDEHVDAGDDYASVMFDNLKALTKALECR
jgi:zinc transport system substrate-binding protein